MRTLGIILLLLFTLQGCGRKGALFLPIPHTEQPTIQEIPEQKTQP